MRPPASLLTAASIACTLVCLASLLDPLPPQAAGGGFGATTATERIPNGSAPSPERAAPLRLTGLRKGPILIYRDDPTAMQVLWQTEDATSCWLEWGLDEGYAIGAVETTEYGDDHQHTFIIPDLIPATRYLFRVTVDGDTYPGSFLTAPPGDADAAQLIAFGDIQTGVPNHDLLSAAIISTYASEPGYQGLNLAMGDLVNYGATESDWDTQLFNPVYAQVRERMANVPFQAALGNHDFYETAYTYDIEATVFRKYFPYPFVDDRYWSFDYGPVHIVMADLYPWYHDPGLPHNIWPGFISPEQAEWLESDLAATEKRWKIVVIHEGGWSAGPHPNNPSIQDTLHPLCVAYDVDVVFSGHNHYYARALVDDVHYVTTGGGGANLYTPYPYNPNIVASDRSHHFCKIDIDGPVLEVTVVRLGGEIIEQFSVVKLTGIEQEPLSLAAPARLHQNHPNPFNPTTSIAFELPVAGPVSLRIYDAGGRRVRTLLDALLPGPSHRVGWDGRDDAGRLLPSGVYWYRLETMDRRSARQLVICR